MPAISDQDMNAMLAEESRVSIYLPMTGTKVLKNSLFLSRGKDLISNFPFQLDLTNFDAFFPVTYHGVQHELRPLRTLHICGQVQRTADSDAGGR